MNAGVCDDAVRRRELAAARAARRCDVSGEAERARRQRLIISEPIVKKLRVGVIYGGRSGEHEVSVASAASIFKHLDRDTVRGGPDPHREGRALGAAGAARRRRSRPREVLKQARDRGARSRSTRRRARQRLAASTSSFPCCTDRTARTARCRACSSWPTCRTSAPGVLGSAVGMDKAVMKTLFAARRPADRAALTSCCGASGSATRAAITGRVAGGAGAIPVFVKPANLGSSVGISKAQVGRGARRRRWTLALAVRPQDRHRGRRRRTRARSSAPCSATTTRRRRSRARSSRRASSTTTKRSTSTAARPRSSRRTLTDGAGRATSSGCAIEAFRRVDGAGMARVDFLLARDTRRAVPERGEHHPRLHDDQHVSEDVGGVRARVSRADRPPDRARARAARREAAAAHQHHVNAFTPASHGGTAAPRRAVVSVVSVVRPSSRRSGWRRCAARRRGGAPDRPHRRAAARARLRRHLRRPLRRGAAPRWREAVPAGAARGLPAARRRGALVADPARSAGHLARSPLPDARRSGDCRHRGVDDAGAGAGRGLVLPRRRATARACSGACCAGERLAAARDGKRIKEALERALALDPDLQDAYFGIGLYHYYADVAPAAAKMLRWLLLLPGGDREQGLERDAARARARPAAARRSRLPAARPLSLVRERSRSGARAAPGPARAPSAQSALRRRWSPRSRTATCTTRPRACAPGGRCSPRRARVSVAEPGLAAIAARLGHRAPARPPLRDRCGARAPARGHRRRASAPHGALARAHLQLGQALDRLGSRPEAVAAYRAAIAAAPADDPLEIAERARAGLAATPDAAAATAYRLSLEGWRALERGALAEAARALAQSLALRPGDPVTAVPARAAAAGARAAKTRRWSSSPGFTSATRKRRRRSTRARASTRRACTSGAARSAIAIELYRAATTVFGGDRHAKDAARRHLARLSASAH